MSESTRPKPVAPLIEDPEMQDLLEKVYNQFDVSFGYAVDEIAVTLEREQVVEACRIAKDDERLRMDYLRCLLATEFEAYFQVTYLVYSTILKKKFMLKVNAPKDDPMVASVVGIWRGADWHEREAAELYGLKFQGHPKLEYLLLSEEFEGKYPLRKDYPYEDIEEWDEETSPRWGQESSLG